MELKAMQISCMEMVQLNYIHDDVKIFQTTGIGITVGLSSVQHNGNAAFAGITTLDHPS